MRIPIELIESGDIWFVRVDSIPNVVLGTTKIIERRIEVDPRGGIVGITVFIDVIGILVYIVSVIVGNLRPFDLFRFSVTRARKGLLARIFIKEILEDKVVTNSGIFWNLFRLFISGIRWLQKSIRWRDLRKDLRNSV